MSEAADRAGAQSAPKIAWQAEDVTTKGVRQRRFDVHRDGRVAPGILWTPDDGGGPRPLILLCHGAGNTKRQPYILSLARRLVRHHGFAAAAIDGPVHGDRRPDGSTDGGLMALEFAQSWSSDPHMVDEMVDDWRSVVDALSGLDEVGEGPVGWWGLSMGTILGVPVVAAEKRISVAVLGCMGTAGPTAAFRERIVADARAVRCPVLFLCQWDDELMDRDDVLSLFGELGSPDKRLHAHPGAHVEVPLEELEASEQFLASRLAT